MDSVRTALRMGASEAMLIYRRTRAEMPARAEEIAHALEEGVQLIELAAPVEYLADERGRVRAMRLQRMRLGEPDEGAIDEVAVDVVIVSVGVSPNPLIPESIDGLEVTSRGTIAVDDTLHSSLGPVYAGGDIVRGGATVILAMGDASMDATLTQKA